VDIDEDASYGGYFLGDHGVVLGDRGLNRGNFAGIKEASISQRSGCLSLLESGDRALNLALAINTSLKTTFADVTVSAIAAADPLFGPNIKPTGAVASIPLNAARRADRMISPRKGAGTSKPLAP
jgi:hypothetical protein